MKIILGSNSPRRRLLLSSLFDRFTVMVPAVNEETLPGELPLPFTRRIAEAKAAAVARCIPAGTGSHLVISADTIVTIDGLILGKPCDHREARNYLSMLSGRKHQVITSIALFLIDAPSTCSDKSATTTEITGVTFKNLDDNDIDEYLNSIDYQDKAGAYAFQENGSRIVERIEGSATNIIGFPLRSFFSALADMQLMPLLYHAPN